MESHDNRVLSGYKEIASFLRVSTKTVQRYLRVIPVTRLGRKVIILEADLMGWVQDRKHNKRKTSK
ncbi:MAG: helix-turn-helix domain-containing protein [Deltaproteobacteria bacterium]|nr:helix-turn-helix domain-containing protein [Deltaproteobacteria bacterium]